MLRLGWGVILGGEQFDLEDWRDALKPPFDPWVVETKRGLALRSTILDAATSASEVHDRVTLLIGLLNGALAVSHQTRTVTIDCVIEFVPDGSERCHVFAEAHLEGRSRVRAEGIVVGPDGKPKSVPLQPSEPQRWLQVAAADDLLADALTYYSRGDGWFDIYKALECLFLRFGGEEAFLCLGWERKARIRKLKRTADNERHARLKNKYNPDPMARGDARQMLGVLIRRALQEAEEQSRARS